MTTSVLPMVQSLIAAIVADAFGALFLTSALVKFGDIGRFASQIAAYRLLPLDGAFPTAYMLIGVQAFLGVWLVSNIAPIASGIAAAFLLGIFAVAIGINVARGRTSLDCGCLPGLEAKLSWRLVVQNIVCAALVLFAAGFARPASIFLRAEALLLAVGAMIVAFAAARLRYTASHA